MIGYKVISTEECRRIEHLFFSRKGTEEALMKEAGKKIALRVMHYLAAFSLEKKVTLLAGRGNNGADGFIAAQHLLKQGILVEALFVKDLLSASPYCQKEGVHFLKMGGKIIEITKEEDLFIPQSSLLIDAILGTGFSKEVSGIVKAMIEKANRSLLPILAIDVPSGLDATTGEIRPIAIRATETITFSLPKIGFFINEGWNCVGKLIIEDIGLPQEILNEAQETFFLLDPSKLVSFLPKAARTSNKYERGSLIAFAGSLGMEGAAKLSTLAALRSGAGIVHLFLPQEVKMENSSFPDEIVKRFWKEETFSELLRECNRSSAVFFGPGLGRSRSTENLITALLPSIEIPCVLDADALFVLAHHPHLSLPKKTILTPHQGEMERLLGKKNQKRDLAFLESCQKFCDEKEVLLVLKGAPTFIFHPKEKALISLHGDPAMATAGSGDVLTGMIAALLAQKLSVSQAALLGVYLHGICGEMARAKKGPFSVIASDLIEQLPEAFQKVLAI